MPTIEMLTAAMFPEIYDRLLQPFAPQIPRTVLERAFVPRGWHDEDHFGYVLRVDGQPVGLIGALFSRRWIEGREVRFCNLHNWYVAPEHRARSLLLMRPILALKDHVITDFSPSGAVLAISKRLGFVKLNRSIRILPSLPWRPKRAKVFDLETEPTAADCLLESEQAISRDHRGIDCQRLVVRSDEGLCLIVASRAASRWLPHVFVHYLSNPTVLAKHHAQIRSELLRRGGHYVAVNATHLARQRIPCSFLADSNQRLVRGDRCPPDLVDSLYSELPLFKLPMYPRPPQTIRGIATRLWQWRQGLARAKHSAER